MENYAENTIKWLESFGINNDMALFLEIVMALLVLIIISYLSNKITQKIILRLITIIIGKTSNRYDDIFLSKNVFARLSRIVPAILVYFLIDDVLPTQITSVTPFIRTFTHIYIVIVVIIVFDALINALHEIYSTLPNSDTRHIKGYVQLMKIIIYGIGVIIIISIILERSPFYLLSGLGAFAMVLMLIFKDTILGLVASIQLSANNMVKPGDWISMPKYDADGDVMEITLNTVKVQNWDKTITTIPTYALVSDSFKNWKGMTESGGRRIKRGIYIDTNSIKFCTTQQKYELMQIPYLKNYIEDKNNQQEEPTNINLFRIYIENYLKNHDKINHQLTCMTRHLQPTEYGLPIEIYAFSKVQAWIEYENIQALIFDHIYANLHKFHLKAYQAPAGTDIQKIKMSATN